MAYTAVLPLIVISFIQKTIDSTACDVIFQEDIPANINMQFGSSTVRYLSQQLLVINRPAKFCHCLTDSF